MGALKLNGWQRIGAVLSLVWLLVIYASGMDKAHFTFSFALANLISLPDDAFQEVETAPASYQLQLRCANKKTDAAYLSANGLTNAQAIQRFELFIAELTSKDETVKTAVGADQFTRRYDVVLARNAKLYGCDTFSRENRAAEIGDSFTIKGFFKYGVLPVLAGWLMAYLSLFAYRWIAVGFKGNTGTNGEG